MDLLLESGADPWDMSSLALRTASDRGFGALVDRLRAAAASRRPAHSTHDSLADCDGGHHTPSVMSGAFALGRGSSGERVCRSTTANATAEALAMAMATASRRGGGAPEAGGSSHARAAHGILRTAPGLSMTSAGQQFLSGANASASHAAYACSGRRPLPLRAAKSGRHWNMGDPSRGGASGANHAACGTGHGHGAAGSSSSGSPAGAERSGGRGGVATLAVPSGWRRHAGDGGGSAAGSPSQSVGTNIVSTTQYGEGISTAILSTTHASAYGSMLQTVNGAAVLAHSGTGNAGCTAPKGGGWPVSRGGGAVPVGLALGQGVVLGPSMQDAFRSFS